MVFTFPLPWDPFLRWDTRVLSHTFGLLSKHIQHVTLRRSLPSPGTGYWEHSLGVNTPKDLGKGLHLVIDLNKKNNIFTIYFSAGKNNARYNYYMNWVLFRRNSFYGDMKLQGKSNTYPPTFIMRNLKARVAKALASPRTCSWWVWGWVSPNQFGSMSPALVVTLCYQGLNSWSRAPIASWWKPWG